MSRSHPGYDREHMTTMAHHTCRETGEATIAVDDSNDELRCVRCGRYCELRGDEP